MRNGIGRSRAPFCVSIIMCALLAACSARQPKPFVIGIVNDAAPNDSILDSFTAAMSEQGYGEGSRISYLYNGYAGNAPAAVDREITRMASARPDALLALGGPTVESAKRLLLGKTIPVIFAPTADPVGRGLVQSMRRPGGNMTGIRSMGDLAKVLEWLKETAPATKNVLVPRSSSAFVTLFDAKGIRTAASLVGVEPLVREMDFPGGMNAAIAALPKNSAILILPTSKSISGFSESATKRRIPIVSFMPFHLAEGALFSYTMDVKSIGRKAARLMGMIIEGTPPAEIPVETVENIITLNLKAARSLGLSISEDVLFRTDTIVR